MGPSPAMCGGGVHLPRRSARSSPRSTSYATNASPLRGERLAPAARPRSKCIIPAHVAQVTAIDLFIWSHRCAGQPLWRRHGTQEAKHEHSRPGSPTDGLATDHRRDPPIVCQTIRPWFRPSSGRIWTAGMMIRDSTYPRLRKFCDWWNTNFDGPIVEVRVGAVQIVTAGDLRHVDTEMRLH